MTSDDNSSKKKGLPGWAIAIIIIASIIVFILSIIMMRMFLKMRKRKLSGIDSITITPQRKAKAQMRARKRRTQAQKAQLQRQAQRKKTQDQQAQKAKTSKFEQKYNSYITNVKNKNQGASDFDINDEAAAQIISELTSKDNFDLQKYKQFLTQIPREIKQKGLTGNVIQAKELFNQAILKDMNQYINKTTNPTLKGAIAYIEKDSLQNLIMKHSGRSQASYTKLYRPFYNQALQQKKKNGTSLSQMKLQ